jgi:hypothetical protein
MTLAKALDLEHKLGRNHLPKAGFPGLNVNASLFGISHCTLSGDNNVGLRHNLLGRENAHECRAPNRLLACDKAALGRQVDLGLLAVLHLQHGGDGHQLLQLRPRQLVSAEAWGGILLCDEVRGEIA